MARTGRPRIAIDWEDFDKLCRIQCTQVEISHWFDCSVDTIERAVRREKKMSFAEYFDKKRGRGRISLRRKQFEVALQGNTAMLIWLGKNILKQLDKPTDALPEDRDAALASEMESIELMKELKQ